ncbi:MAG: hypothetical protein ACREVG_11665, partial [Burkholderiales bacterium]
MRLTGNLILWVVAVLVTACVAPPWQSEPQPAPTAKPAPPTAGQLNEALTRLNNAFQDAYERILDERGSRTDAAARATAFDALEAALRRLGMIV